MGSQLVPLASAVPQQLPLFPLSAACPYFSLTISLMFVPSIPSSLSLAPYARRKSCFCLFRLCVLCELSVKNHPPIQRTLAQRASICEAPPYLQISTISCGLSALFRVQHSE